MRNARKNVDGSWDYPLEAFWKVGDRVALMPDDLKDGFHEQELIDRGPPTGTVVELHEGLYAGTPEEEPDRTEVRWDEPFDDKEPVTRERPGDLTLLTWE